MKYVSGVFLVFTGVIFVQVWQVTGERRPIWNIAHMINGIGQISSFLNKGANAIEADVSLNSKCEAEWVYHGFPCDCFRFCWRSALLSEYLLRLKAMPIPGNTFHHPNLTMVMFDLKIIEKSNACIYKGGQDFATKLINYLWNNATDLKVVLSFPTLEGVEFMKGFLKTLEDANAKIDESKLAWDFSGKIDLEDVASTYKKLGITKGRWLGEGTSNCLPVVTVRLANGVKSRDDLNCSFDKVYFWTIDLKSAMREALRLGVDGMITNFPERLREVLEEAEFYESCRLATTSDDITHRSTVQIPRSNTNKYFSLNYQLPTLWDTLDEILI